MFEHSPLIGRANPLAPPMRLLDIDGVVHGQVTFGSAYEGPARVRARRLRRRRLRRAAGRHPVAVGQPGHDRTAHHPLPLAHAAARRAALGGRDRPRRRSQDLHRGPALRHRADGTSGCAPRPRASSSASTSASSPTSRRSASRPSATADGVAEPASARGQAGGDQRSARRPACSRRPDTRAPSTLPPTSGMRTLRSPSRRRGGGPVADRPRRCSGPSSVRRSA